MNLFGESGLSRSLKRWTAKGGDLDEVLGEHEDAPVKRKAEAEAICAALDACRREPGRGGDQSVGSTLQTLTAFFQQVSGEKAFEVLRDEGLPRLRLWVEDALNGKPPQEGDVLFILKILAMYRQRQDVDWIARAARAPLEPEGYLWSVILEQLNADHPYTGELIAALSDPLPPQGFIRVAFLDLANRQALDGKLPKHPFDSEEGRAQLESWLRDSDEENFSYAHSATAALPFLAEEARGSLFRLAEAHPDVAVRLEAAWARARMQDEEGIRRLVEYAGDPRFSERAQEYLGELGLSHRLPEHVRSEEFAALAEMAAWLSHPQEFGRPPDTLEVMDSRVLRWPPTKDRRKLWLVKYAYQDRETKATDAGVGLVGSITFALFGEDTADLAPSALYGLYCCWELQTNQDPRAPEERTPENGIRILREYGNALEDPA